MAGKIQFCFKRYEKKYLLMPDQLTKMMAGMEEHMCADQFGRYTICNIYYDTDDYQLIRTSLEKPVYKEKLRMRSYGVPGSEDEVFVELKKKYESVVYKSARLRKLRKRCHTFMTGSCRSRRIRSAARLTGLCTVIILCPRFISPMTGWLSQGWRIRSCGLHLIRICGGGTGSLICARETTASRSFPPVRS